MDKAKPEETYLEQQCRKLKKELKIEIKSSKKRCLSDLCRIVDPWGMLYSLATKRLIGKSEIPGLRQWDKERKWDIRKMQRRESR